MRTMDRYLFRSFLLSFVICFSAMVSLYVIIDLFSNIDEFIKDHAGALALARRICKYYFVHSFEYYARLSPIITQVAAMTTLASLHRNNEIVALLAAGIPTRRALVPILLGASVMIGIDILNRELILPPLSEILQRMHADIDANEILTPNPHIDNDRVLIRGREAYREDMRLESVDITLPTEITGQLLEIHAARAYFRRDSTTGETGWLLDQCTPVQIRSNDKIKPLENGQLFLYSNISFHEMIRRRNWTTFASTWDLIKEIQDERAKNPQELRATVHSRIMHPALFFLLVLIGIPFVLQWERKNIYRSIAVSMLISALFFVADVTATYFASYGFLDPLTAAWMPLFIFAPVAMSLYHRIGT